MALKMRAHHLYCGRYIPKYFGWQRGQIYRNTEAKIIDAISPDNAEPVELVQGCDTLCPECPECRDGRCASPAGSEDEVRKWDAIVCKELGWTYGTVRTGGEWWDLVEKKRPLAFCARCGLRRDCLLEQALRDTGRLT